MLTIRRGVSHSTPKWKKSLKTEFSILKKNKQQQKDTADSLIQLF